MRVLICGGGTAGHINPAIAVADEIKKQDNSSTVLFIGRDGGKENKLIFKAGYEMKTIKMQGLKRSLSLKNIKSISYAISAIPKAKEIIKNFNPDVVFGTGGYLCWPVIVAAKRMGIKTFLHESNTSPGLTTKLLSKKVNLMLLNSEKTAGYLSKKTRYKVVGNPIRSDFFKIDRESARSKLGLQENDIFILSFGGSIGSDKINKTIIEVMQKYSSKDDKIKHLHGCGERYYESIKNDNNLRRLNGCKIVPYIDDIPTMMHASDIVISRSGAMTISEICYVGVASILIPSPNVSDNHQYKNAISLKNRGAAIIIEEKDLTFTVLKNRLAKLKSAKFDRKNVAKNAGRLFVNNSASLIVSEFKR